MEAGTSPSHQGPSRSPWPCCSLLGTHSCEAVSSQVEDLETVPRFFLSHTPGTLGLERFQHVHPIKQTAMGRKCVSLTPTKSL